MRMLMRIMLFAPFMETWKIPPLSFCFFEDGQFRAAPRRHDVFIAQVASASPDEQQEEKTAKDKDRQHEQWS